jgi:protein ImuB
VAGAAVEVVPPGESAAFLAPLPLGALEPAVTPELVGVLRRLGLRTLGDLAALPVAKIVGRFGAEGLLAHRLARGLDGRPPATSPPQPDLRVEAEVDPPVDRVDAAAFVARGLADDLHRRLSDRGTACTRLLVGAETEHGERHERMWRTEGVFSPGAITDRLRWQLEGWLQSGQGRPSGGISRLWLAPDEVVPAGGRQLSFTQGSIDAVEAAERAGRAVARVQGLVGVEAVLVPDWRGGRGPGERVALVTLGTGDLSQPRPARSDRVAEPWPGSIPPPLPAIVHPEPIPVEVLDATGRPVEVSGRGEQSAAPASVGGKAVVDWAGPWPCDERWWDRIQHRRRARLQVITADGVAHLLVLEGNRWAIEATYD